MHSNARDKPRRSRRRKNKVRSEKYSKNPKAKIPREDIMQFTRRTLVAGALASPLTAALADVAQADNWPSGIIKIIVPFPPGGSVDPIARMAQPGLQQKLNATLVIENRAGSSGSVGTELVAKSPPDGYTWVFVFDTHAVNPFLFDLKFDTVK